MPTKDVLLYDYPGSICSQMARLTLVEKGVAYRRQIVDIMGKAEQFEPWYTALNPRAVVPTLVLDGEVITDTLRIVPRIDKDLDGPPLSPSEPESADAMMATMRDIMALHYGVLLYGRRLEADRTSKTVIDRGRFLREQRALHPDRAEALDRRIAGNQRLQEILADPDAVEHHEGEARALVNRLNTALESAEFVSGKHYTLADTFASAALARFRMHGFDTWWADGENPRVATYYQAMKARPSWQEAGVVDSGDEHDI